MEHFSHNHPLVFIEEKSHESEKGYRCSGCQEVISGPTFSCVTCGFHLDENCAQAPSEISHPFHRNHSLNLLASSPYARGTSICNFCDKICKKFVYHCSCNLDLHIKCALFLYNIAGKKNGDQLQHIAYEDPSISTENHSAELKKAKCFACWKPLLDFAYLSLDCGFYLHKKCIELPLEINHLCHRRHSLFLQINSVLLPCQICQETQTRGLVYCCSICKFVLHIECVSPSPIIEDKSSHEHPFTSWLRRSSFICDACGTSGNYISYICSTCCLTVHEKCISLPRIIKHIWHHHPIFHKYFVVDNEECRTLECGFCHEEIDKECGSYYCSECKFILHVNCALQETDWYEKIESMNAYEKLIEDAMLVADTMDPSYFVIKKIRLGENVINTEIKHFSHGHSLIHNDEVKDHRCCNGCSELIATSFYRCLECDFFLHKSCAELPRKKHIWFHIHEYSFILISICVFDCSCCASKCIGLAYKCMKYLCEIYLCIRCAEVSLTYTSQGHKHLLYSFVRYHGLCNACGGRIDDDGIMYRCKGCDFNLHSDCAFLPQNVWNKCDEHFLTLTYHEDNDNPDCHYCDICERERSPNTWFYHCAICDTSAHLKCVVGDFPFLTLGSTFLENNHPHILVFVQKDYPYPECSKCRQPCSDLALECSETDCIYITHWRCVE